MRINVATSVSVFAMWNPPKHLTSPLVITSTFLHWQCFTWNFVTTSFIIPHSFWDGTLESAAVVCDWDQPRCKLKHGVYRNWTWLSKMQNVTSAWTVSQMRRWSVSFSSFAFSPSFSQKLMTLCLHKQDLGDAGAHTQMLKHAPFLVATTYSGSAKLHFMHLAHYRLTAKENWIVCLHKVKKKS